MLTAERFAELRALIASTPKNDHDKRDEIRAELMGAIPPSQRTTKLAGTDDLLLVLRVAVAFSGLDP